MDLSLKGIVAVGILFTFVGTLSYLVAVGRIDYTQYAEYMTILVSGAGAYIFGNRYFSKKK